MYFKTQCHMPSGSRCRLWPIKEYGNLSRGIVSNILVEGSINAYHANCCEIVKLSNNSGILCENIFLRLPDLVQENALRITYSHLCNILQVDYFYAAAAAVAAASAAAADDDDDDDDDDGDG